MHELYGLQNVHILDSKRVLNLKKKVRKNGLKKVPQNKQSEAPIHLSLTPRNRLTEGPRSAIAYPLPQYLFFLHVLQ